MPKMKLTEGVIALFVYFSCVYLSTAFEEMHQEEPSQCYVGTPSKLDLVNCTVKEEEEKDDDRETLESIDGGERRQRRHLELGKNGSSSHLLPNATTINTLIHGERDSNRINTEEEEGGDLGGGGGGGRRQSNSCLVFISLLLNTSSGNNASKSTEETTRFDCDSNRICDENYKYENNRRENVTYQGQLGDLFCCRGSKCNERHSAFPTRFAPSSDRPLRCSAGPNVKEPILCPIETLDCFNRTSFVANSTLEEYGCDLARHCTGWSGNPNGECSKFVDERGREMELCCCATSDCNALSSSLSSSSQSQMGFGLFGNKMTWETYGWIAVTSITLSVAAIVLIVRRRRRNRMYSDISVISDPRYQRLTANFTAGDTDDVKMLLAD